MEDGLPHNIVQAIAQTRDGYLWVGTREGLARFDGTRLQGIELTPEIRHPSILCLLESHDGSLWVGTENSGVLRMFQGKVFRCAAPNGALDFAAYELHESAGAIWIASPSGHNAVERWPHVAHLRLQRRDSIRMR